MTETELEALRDSLTSLNNELDILDSRVTSLENLAVPKGDYFNQLKASFEGSPECCECGTTPTPDELQDTCICTSNASVFVLFNATDFGSTSTKPVGKITINNLVFNNTENLPFEDALPPNLPYLQIQSEYLHTGTPPNHREGFGELLTLLGTIPLCISVTAATTDDGYFGQFVEGTEQIYTITTDENGFEVLNFCLTP